MQWADPNVKALMLENKVAQDIKLEFLAFTMHDLKLITKEDLTEIVGKDISLSLYSSIQIFPSKQWSDPHVKTLMLKSNLSQDIKLKFLTFTMDDLKLMSSSDLTKIVEKNMVISLHPPNQLLSNSEVSSLLSVTKSSEDLEKWFKLLGIEKYVSSFKDNGYIMMSDIQSLSNEKIEEMITRAEMGSACANSPDNSLQYNTFITTTTSTATITTTTIITTTTTTTITSSTIAYNTTTTTTAATTTSVTHTVSGNGLQNTITFTIQYLVASKSERMKSKIRCSSDARVAELLIKAKTIMKRKKLLDNPLDMNNFEFGLTYSDSDEFLAESLELKTVCVVSNMKLDMKVKNREHNPKIENLNKGSMPRSNLFDFVPDNVETYGEWIEVSPEEAVFSLEIEVTVISRVPHLSMLDLTERYSTTETIGDVLKKIQKKFGFSDCASSFCLLLAGTNIPLFKNTCLNTFPSEKELVLWLLPNSLFISKEDEELLKQLQGSNGVKIEHHTRRLRTYQNCFSGSNLVTWLVENKVAEDRQSASIIATELWNKGSLEHVTTSTSFQDDNTSLYRFITKIEMVEQSAMTEILEMKKMQGWLLKKGKIYRSWKKRYFVLFGMFLSYYEKKKSNEPKGTVYIAHARLETKPISKDKPYSFSILATASNRTTSLSCDTTSRNRKRISSATEPSPKRLILTASNDTEKELWIEALKTHIYVPTQ